MKFSVLLLLLISSLTLGNGQTKLEQANELFKKFKGCKSQKKAQECVTKITAQSSTNYLRRKLAIWLKNHRIHSKLYECPRSKVEFMPYTFHQEVSLYRCFRHRGSKYSNYAIIYFKDEENGLKISGLQFFR